jgi:ubiquinone/menaquinone biosynthesis C-methylase UbiE
MTQTVQNYWNGHIHDISVVKHPVGTREFFHDLEEYRFSKQNYLPTFVNFSGYKDKKLLEVGCGVGIDLARFAKEGALVTGIDLSERAIQLARTNFAQRGVKGELRVMDGEYLKFDSETFDMVYAHGVLPYTTSVTNMIGEIYRVLKPGGEAIIQSYNKRSWLYFLSKTGSIKLEHEESPAFHTFTISEFKRLLKSFSRVEIIIERFPVKTRLHKGAKGLLYNVLFVGIFNAIPRRLVRRWGWHLLAKVTK